MTPSTIRKFANTENRYKGYLFKDESEYITDSEDESEDESEKENEDESEDESEDEIENKQKEINKDNKTINVYSYKNNDGNVVKYFIGKEIADFIGVKDSSQCIRYLVSDKNKINFKNYQGIKEPKLKPTTILITKDGIDEILSKSRKLNFETKSILNNYLI
jgi:type III secretory pathway component EscV